jgi:hypothetical protein
LSHQHTHTHTRAHTKPAAHISPRYTSSQNRACSKANRDKTHARPYLSGHRLQSSYKAATGPLQGRYRAALGKVAYLMISSTYSKTIPHCRASGREAMQKLSVFSPSWGSTCVSTDRGHASARRRNLSRNVSLAHSVWKIHESAIKFHLPYTPTFKCTILCRD